jgi:phosphate transport system substrate-binding protein
MGLARWGTMVLALGWTVGVSAADITGAGSTFAQPILSAWSSAYATAANVSVNYQPIGSGGGITLIRSSSVDFGASDMPLPPDDLAKSNLLQFPIVIGGVVPVVNLDGVAANGLQLTGPVLASIYLGKITRWNDAGIAALNPTLTLPAADIVVVHRTDGSGTTFNWVNYLSKMAPEWKSSVGEGTTVQWPIGIGGRGNEGVVTQVQQTKNAIGYVEYAFAVKANLSTVALQNAAGKFVSPSTEGFAAAATHADWASAKAFFLVLTNAPGEDAWPITATTFVMVAKQPTKPERHKATLGFFRWALEHGQADATKLGYVPLPATLLPQIEAAWATVPQG